MRDLLHRFARCPVVVAPMAGGPSTPGLVTAATAAGALGFLAAGYKTAAALRAEMDTVQAAGTPFGVNVFVPGAPAPDRAAAPAAPRRCGGHRPRADRRGRDHEPSGRPGG